MKEAGITTLATGIVVERKVVRGKLVINAYTEKEFTRKNLPWYKKLFK